MGKVFPERLMVQSKPGSVLGPRGLGSLEISNFRPRTCPATVAIREGIKRRPLVPLGDVEILTCDTIVPLHFKGGIVNNHWDVAEHHPRVC